MSNHDTHDGAHHGGVKQYLTVFAALCVLTAISFAVGNSPLMETPALGWTLMMVVSCAKALLVMSFFMHLIWEANWKWVLTIPASIMSLFLVLMLIPDIGARTHFYSEERELYMTEHPLVGAPVSHGSDHVEQEHGDDLEPSDGHGRE